ncbi:hypothetical protein ACGFYU_02240 [Streptomyces sp. NPDC048337]|uniref:hypothetical protein n=1 Tax=Streptomyces sp. NPDC048337 TaxID=3365535 RepID=UPI00371812D5
MVKEFARGCGLDQNKVYGLWQAARTEHLGRRGPQDVPGVEQIYNYADLGVFLADLRAQKGHPPYRTMERRAEATVKQFGRLPHSTAQRIGARRTRPSLDQMRAFLVGCDISPERHGPLVRAWHRADARFQEDRAREINGPNAAAHVAFPDELREQGATQLARDLGYSPIERFRGFTRPWSAYCRSCGRTRRIRLDWEVKRLRRADGGSDMYCPDCKEHPTPR